MIITFKLIIKKTGGTFANFDKSGKRLRLIDMAIRIVIRFEFCFSKMFIGKLVETIDLLK